MYLIKRTAYKPNVLQEGFEDLTDVLSQYSEDTIKSELQNVISGNFDEKFFLADYFKKGDVKGNEEKKDSSKIESAMIDYMKKDFNERNKANVFYRKCMIDDEINCDPKEKIFNQAIDKYGKTCIKELQLIDKIFDLCENSKIKEDYFTEQKPKLQKKKKNPENEETQKVLQFVEKGKEIPFDVLKQADEPIGTKNIKTRSLDVGRRDYPFVVLDKDIVIKGTSKDTHTTAINKFMKKHMNEDSRYKDVKENLDEVKQDRGKLWYRHEGNNALRDANFDVLAFGHVKNGMAFIDTTQGCSADEVANAVKSELGVKKVYDSESYGGSFLNLRVASRLIPRYNIELHNMAIQEMKKFLKH